MAVLKPRGRLVYFRVSEDEFHQFVTLCEQGGARSVSDLARSAVQRLIAEEQRQREDNALDERMRELDRLIAAVTKQLNLLAVHHGQDRFPMELGDRNEGLLAELSGAGSKRPEGEIK